MPTPSEDPDAALVARVQKGETDVFENWFADTLGESSGLWQGLWGT